MSGYDAQANELMRRLRAQWVRDFEQILDAAVPGLLAGRIGTGSLPRGTAVFRGDYLDVGRYRAGDVVFYDGVAYIAAAPSQGVTPGTDATKWEPVGMAPHDIVGPLHTASGLTPGWVLTATSPTAIAFAPPAGGTGLPTMRRELVTNGDPVWPEIVFDNGDIVEEEVPW